MNITYLGHSGFLAETDAAYYLFDYIRGTLPPFKEEKALYVFASHWHEDHFSREIFGDVIYARAERYFISRDIPDHCRETGAEWFGDAAGKITITDADTEYGFLYGRVTTLRSTDEGVAFAVREDGGAAVYHAGDLNWWHWEGEPDPWNPDMEKAYQTEIGKLKGQTFDAAFVPLDPRLEDAYWYGLGYFEDQVSARHIFPMHFWNDYSVIPRYLREHRAEDRKYGEIHLITKENESYEI